MTYRDNKDKTQYIENKVSLEMRILRHILGKILLDKIRKTSEDYIK
jgi:hypothetical protein